MNDVYYGTPDGRVGKLGHVEEIELTAESVEEDYLDKYFSPETMEFSAVIEDTEQFMRNVVYGGDRGRYNGYVLARDGYLNGEKAWL